MNRHTRFILLGILAELRSEGRAMADHADTIASRYDRGQRADVRGLSSIEQHIELARKRIEVLTCLVNEFDETTKAAT